MSATTINTDLSSTTVSDDGSMECVLPNYNPGTLVPFGSAEDVLAYVASIQGREYFWTPKLPDEEKAAIAAAAASASIISAVQSRLDTWAQSHGYDSILSLCTYASSTVERFKAEGQNGVDKRDATWAALIGVMADVDAGTRQVPTGYADIEVDLPVLDWPG